MDTSARPATSPPARQWADHVEVPEAANDAYPLGRLPVPVVLQLLLAEVAAGEGELLTSYDRIYRRHGR